MNFWISAIALLTISAALISWPLFTGPAKDRVIGLFVLLIIPLASILLYQSIGTPAALNLPEATPQQAAQDQAPHSTQQGQMDELVASLQQRMAENPDDPDGWLILGRSLKSMQRFSEAQTALSNANRLSPNNPLIMIELAETSLFASGKPEVSPQARQLIESALAIDPNMQKALWMKGMMLTQDGDEAQAIVIWQRLLEQLDPSSGAAQSVSEQIEMSQARMGQAGTAPVSPEPVAADSSVSSAPVAEPVVATTNVADSGIPVTITIAAELGRELPGNAIMFVFIHPAGAKGMPLAVKRLAARGFPMSLNFSEADLLNPAMSLKDFDQLDISARISMNGGVAAMSGDYQANLATIDTKAVSTIALHLDQRVP